MTAIEYMKRQEERNRRNLRYEQRRGAPEDVLENILKKISYYAAAVEALRKEAENRDA